MDRAPRRDPAPQRGAAQTETASAPLAAPEPALSPDSAADAPRPRALSSIPESEPLLPGDEPAAGDARRAANGRAVQFSGAASSGSSSSSSASLAGARPPDGGWGWVVVFASFMVNLIADGITFSFGVFYTHFLDYFGESKGKTAWIAGIFMAMPLLSGPVASFLTDRYGCRRVTVAGALLAALGFVISAFVDNIETLFLTFGIMAGFGLSLCYVAAVVIVAYYFEEKRSLATGISVCGSGIGTFLFAPLTYALLEEYGWRGTTLILAGLFLNMAVCGLLFRDLPWQAELSEERARERRRRRHRARERRFGASGDSLAEPPAQAPAAAALCSSLVDLPTFMTRGEGVSPEVFELMSSRGRAYALMAQTYSGAAMLPSRSFSDSGRLHELSPPPPPRRGRRAPPAPAPAAPGPAPAAPASFLRDLRVHRHSLTYRGAMLNISRYRLRASSCPNIFRNSMTTIAKEKVQWYAGLWELWDLCVEILDVRHFRNPRFAAFALSNFLLYMWYDVPYVYLADAATRRGVPERAASLLISLIGILNMFGEILLGWAGDLKRVPAVGVYAGCMLACGGATLAVPALLAGAVPAVPALGAAAGAFGAFIAANYSLTSIILVDIITLDKFTNAYGLLLLMQGLANLLGTPLAGWLCDMTDSYDLSFYLAGVFIALSGLILLVPLRLRCSAPAADGDPPAAGGDPPEAGGDKLKPSNGDVKLNGTLLV